MERDYNIEDTAKLMTEAGIGGRRKRLIIIAAAVIAVLLIAALSIRLVGDRRYNNQIAIAEKALTEGNYDEAEAAYLGAVDMQKRKPKAREGLAYLYAYTGRFEESESLYRALYDDTEDEKYIAAADDVSNGLVPVYDDVVPVRFWRDIDEESVPYNVEMVRFLTSAASDFSEGSDRYFAYDSNDPDAGADLLRGIMEAKYEFVYQIPAGVYYVDDSESSRDKYYSWIDWEQETDPRGWKGGAAGYELTVFDQDKVDMILKEIFHVPDKTIENWVKQGEAEKAFYREDGKYYSFCWIDAEDGLAADILSVKTDGVKFCIEYNSGDLGEELDVFGSEEDPYDFVSKYGFVDWHVDMSSGGHTTCYAMMELRTIDGEKYWTMTYNGTEPPPEFTDAGTDKEQKPDYSVKTEMDDEMRSEFIDFISYLPYYSNGGSLSVQKTENGESPEYYNYKSAADCAILYNIMWNIPCINFDAYPFDFARDEMWESDEADPLNRAVDEYGNMMMCYRTNADAVDWVAKNIFNASDEEIAGEVAVNEEKSVSDKPMGSFYRHDGYYYLITGGLGWETAYEFEIDDVRTEGDYFIIDYTQTEYMMSEEPTGYLHFEVRMQYKIIDGKGYWSLYERKRTD